MKVMHYETVNIKRPALSKKRSARLEVISLALVLDGSQGVQPLGLSPSISTKSQSISGSSFLMEVWFPPGVFFFFIPKKWCLEVGQFFVEKLNYPK